MGIYDDFLGETQPGGQLEKLKRVSPSAIAQLRISYPQLPSDYIAFLEEIGCGEVGNGAYVIYGGVLEPDEIYDEVTAEELQGVLLFGDDMQGYCSGFATKEDWIIVEIDPTDMSCIESFQSFADFVRDRLQEVV